MENLKVERNIPINLNLGYEDKFAESKWDFYNANGHGTFKKIVFKNIHICHGELSLASGHYVGIECPEPVVELFFSLVGSSAIYNKNGDKKTFAGNSHTIFHCPDNEYYSGITDNRETTYTFHIVFTEPYFSNLVNTAFPVLESFKECIAASDFAWLMDENMPITPEMNSILHEIMNCERTGMLKGLFIESKVIKLLMLQLEQLEQLKSKKTTTLKSHDIERIQYAKTLLDKNMSNTFSLVELAHMAGINDFKLKKGFKEIYNTTVFGYLTTIRMQEARKLLLDNSMPIADIASYCGYKYVQNFSTAFKQKYGISPKQIQEVQ